MYHISHQCFSQYILTVQPNCQQQCDSVEIEKEGEDGFSCSLKYKPVSACTWDEEGKGLSFKVLPSVFYLCEKEFPRSKFGPRTKLISRTGVSQREGRGRE